MSRFRRIAVTCCLFICSISPLRADVITYVDNLAGFLAATDEVARESSGDFGPDPAAADNIASISRTGTGNLGSNFTYTVENRDTLAQTTNANLLTAAGGSISGLYFDTNATLDVETPLMQGVNLGAWGVDSSGTGNNNSSGGVASRNAAVVTLAAATTALNFDLVDFEARAGGQEALLVLGLADTIIHSESFAFGDFGDNAIHNFGITTNLAMAFDTAVFVLGDVNDGDLSNGYGGTEFWGIGNGIVGTASVAAVPEPTHILFLAAIVGITFLRKRSNRTTA